MKEWYSARELAGMPGTPETPSGVRRQAGKDNWRRQKKKTGKGLEYHISTLPEATQAHLNNQRTQAIMNESSPSAATPDLPPLSPPARKKHIATQRELESLWSTFAKKNINQQKRARRALAAVQMLHRLNDESDAVKAAGHSGYSSRAQIQILVADHFDVSRGSIEVWRRKVRDYDASDWLAVLAPKDAGRTVIFDIPPEAWDCFKADYLRLEAPALAACYERLTRIATDRGWIIPSEKTFERRVKKALSTSIVTLARQGNEALKRMYPHQERDRSVFHALEAVNADGHKFDTFVRWPDGEIGRPLMCAWQDIFSGKILSYRVDKTENSDSIRLSFGDMVEAYGIPSEAFLDNGRGFASKWMTGGTPTRYRFKVKEEEPSGIMTTLGVKIHWCTPYHGQAKPIERAFRDLCEYVAKHPALAGAYTGNNPTAKPENYGSKAIDIDVFMKVLDTEIDAHNARTGRAGESGSALTFQHSYFIQGPIQPLLQ